MRKVKEMKDYIKENTKGITYTINIYKTKKRKFNLRVKPFCKITPKKDEHNRMKIKLKRNGIQPTEQNNQLVLGSISSCMLALKFLEPPKWWRKVLYMMEDGKHTEKEGLIAIVEKRNEEMEHKTDRKWTKERVLEEMSKK